MPEKQQKDHWGQEYIARLSIIEVIVGDGKEHFNPNDILLACQYIKMVVVALGFTPEKEHGIDWWKPFVDIALKEQIVNPGEINDYTKPLNRELAAAIGFRALMKFEEYAYEQWYNYNKAKMDDYNLINDKYKQEVVMACSVNAGRILTTTAGRKLTAFSRSGIDHPV